MKDYEDEAFDELEKSLQRKVAHGVTDGSKVTIDRDKLEQVLEALYGFIPYLPLDDDAQCGRYDKAITTLKEALEDV